VNFATLVGLGAATCTTAAYIPQVVKAWRSKHTADISIGMFLLMNFGVLLWLAYGTMVGDVPLVVSNTLTLCLTGTVLALKIWFG
jgi:MtN3 and saliva related transmembrane protein